MYDAIPCALPESVRDSGNDCRLGIVSGECNLIEQDGSLMDRAHRALVRMLIACALGELDDLIAHYSRLEEFPYPVHRLPVAGKGS
jgi:hypothetical protein